MDRDTAYAKFAATVAEVLDVGAAEVVPGAKWAEDLDADSLSVLEITLALSDAFSITIPEVEPADMATVGDAFELVWAVVSAEA